MKFPVAKAFRATFAYLTRHGVDLMKALWLPTALLVLLQFYAMPSFFTAMSSLIALDENPDPADAAAALGGVGKWGLVLMAGSMIAYPMMTAASLVHIVRGETLKTPFYLRYGGDELRILAAYALLSLMLIAISLVGGLAATLVAFFIALALPQGRNFFSGLADLAVNLVTLWFRVRLATLFPASIATGTTGFGAAWSSTNGNAAGLFFFFFLVWLSLTPFALAIMAPFAGDFWPLFERLLEAGDDKAAAREAVIPIFDAVGKIFSVDHPKFALFAPILFASTLVSTAVVNIAAGIAWRYLTDRTDDSNDMQRAMAA